MSIFTLGDEIKRLRKERGISQEELASMANISRATLSKLENGYLSKVSITTLESIVALLGYTIEIKAKNPFIKR